MGVDKGELDVDPVPMDMKGSALSPRTGSGLCKVDCRTPEVGLQLGSDLTYQCCILELELDCTLIKAF